MTESWTKNEPTWWDKLIGNPTRELLGIQPEPEPEVLDFTDSYMRKVHDPDRLLRDFEAGVPAEVEFDTLVGTGLSGTLAVVELARRLGVNYLVVRKENDGSHSWTSVEGKLGKRWVFVDDFIDTGATFGRVYDEITRLTENKNFTTEFVGMFTYKWGEWDPAADERIHRLLGSWSENYKGEFEPLPKPEEVSEKAKVAYTPTSTATGGTVTIGDRVLPYNAPGSAFLDAFNAYRPEDDYTLVLE